LTALKRRIGMLTSPNDSAPVHIGRGMVPPHWKVMSPLATNQLSSHPLSQE
jgi:hypothetical protein